MDARLENVAEIISRMERQRAESSQLGQNCICPSVDSTDRTTQPLSFIIFVIIIIVNIIENATGGIIVGYRRQLSRSAEHILKRLQQVLRGSGFRPNGTDFHRHFSRKWRLSRGPRVVQLDETADDRFGHRIRSGMSRRTAASRRTAFPVPIDGEDESGV